LLKLLHLLLEVDLAGLLAQGVELRVVRLLLVLDVKHLPFLLEGADELVPLLLGHEILLAVLLLLLFDLHLPHQVVLVLNLIFDRREVLGALSVGILLKEVLVLRAGQFRCYKSKH
jgi:hypothetical protein